MPRKRKGQNLRNVARLQKSFHQYDTDLEKKKKKEYSLTLSSEEAQPTAAVVDQSSSSSPCKKMKCTNEVEVVGLPITPDQSTTPRPSTKCSREMKMLNRGEREHKKNIGAGSTDDPQANPKISSGNRLLELRSLEDLIQQNTRCKICAGTLLLKEKTLGIATRLELNCRKCNIK